MKLIDQLLQLPFLLRGAFQLEQHVLHQKTVSHPSAIVLGVRFGPRVAGECGQLPFSHALRDQKMLAALSLHGGNREEEQ